MARGIWISLDEFIAFSKPQKSLAAQITSRSRAIDFYRPGMYLSSPGPILKAQERDIRTHRELRADPLVGGRIRRHKAALRSLECGLERGHASARVFRFIRGMLDNLDLSRTIGETGDVVLYGYQPCGIMWGRSVRVWAVTDIVGKPPGWFQFDADNCLCFRARGAGVESGSLSPSKFVVLAQNASYDNPYGFPDLSMCFWPAAFKKGGMKFWLRFAEKFGSPWVIGKHLRSANDAGIEKLLDFMEQMVEDMAVAIPDDSSIGLKAADGKADSSEVFRELIAPSRSEIFITLLGQNQATEANSNRASAQAGPGVTADVRDVDADITQAVVNQVIRTVVTPNFGDVSCPVWAMWEQETIDNTRTTRDEKLTRMGLCLTPQYFKREYQLQDGDIDETPPSERQNNILPPPFVEAINVDIQAQQQLDDALDTLMNGDVLNGTLKPVPAPLFKRVENGVSPTELLGELVELHPQMNTDDPQERLARILPVANIWGRLHERDNG